MNDQRIFFEAPKLALTRVEADALDVSPATWIVSLSAVCCGPHEAPALSGEICRAF